MSEEFIEYIATVAELLQTVRRAAPEPKPKDLCDIGCEVNKYHQSVKFLNKCISENFVDGSCVEDINFDEHKQSAKEVAEAVEAADASYKQCQFKMEKAVQEIQRSVLGSNTFLQDQSNDVTISEPEGRLFWLGAFGEVDKVKWEHFWKEFCSYIGPVYGCHMKFDEDGNPEFEVQTIELGVKSCLVVDKRGEEKENVAMKDFREYCERFGPWNKLLVKTLTLCELTGEPLSWFLPSANGAKASKFFKNPKNRSHTFLIRFSSKSGCLVRQTRQAKVIIENSDSGYIVKGHAKTHKDVPSALKTVWKKSVEQFAEEWYESLRGLDTEADESGYQQMLAEGEEEEKKGPNISDVMEKLNTMDSKLDKIHKDLVQFGLRLLTGLDSTMPRLFFVIPEKTPEGETLYQKCKNKISDTFQTHWRVFLLCEGNHFIEQEGQEYYACHITRHEGYKVSLPKDSVMKALPYIRVGLKVASVACAVAASGVVDLGPIGDLLDAYAGSDKLALLDEMLGETQEFLTGKKAELPADDQVMDDYNALRTLLDEWLGGENLAEGRCADLRMMWHSDSSKKVWVCEDHEVGLTGLDDTVEQPEQKGALLGPVGEDETYEEEAGAVTQTSSITSDGGGSTRDYSEQLKRNHTLLNIREAKLTVKVISGEKLPNVDSGVFGNKSDPYVFILPLDVAGVCLPRKETKVIQDDLNPVWDEIFQWEPKRGIESIEFEVWDWNKVLKHQFMGRCEVRIVDSLDNSFILEDELALLPKIGHKNVAKGSIKVKIEYSFVA